MPVVNIILLSILIEAVVSAIKPLWSKDSERMSVAEIVSIALGIILSVSCRLNVMEYVAEWEVIADAPPFGNYIFYILTGIALGRGPSFLWDVWERIRKAANGKIMEGAVYEIGDKEMLEGFTPVDVDKDGNPDLNIDNWSLNQIKTFCALNGIDTTGCTTRDEYLDAIEHGGRVSNEPPADGGAD